MSDQGTARWLRAVMRAAVIVPLVVFVVAALHAYVDENRKTDIQVDQAVRAAQEHALKVFETAATLAARAGDAAALAPDDAIRAQEFVWHQRLSAMVSGMTHIRAIWLFDADGAPLVSSRTYPVPSELNTANRDYFLAHKNNPTLSVFASGALRAATDNETFFNITRRRTAPNGAFMGVVSVSLWPEYFTDFYKVFLRDDGDFALMLVREDGAVLLRFPDSPNAPAQIDASAFRASSVSAGQQRIVSSAIDGEERLVSVRSLGNSSIYVVGGARTAQTLARWQLRAGLIAAITIPLAATIILLCWVALQKVRRENEAVAHWREEMTRRITTEEALMRAQKLDAMGQMTGGVAHDFNNLLQVVSSNVHILKLKLGPGAASAQLAAIERALTTGESLTRQLLAFSRQQALRAEQIDLCERMPSICELITHSLRADISLECHTDPETWPIFVDGGQLNLALLNVAVNSRDAMPHGGSIHLRARNASSAEVAAAGAQLSGDFVAIIMTDTGHGVPEEIAERVFEPFFTTKEVGKGTGLGLSQVYGFANQSGGAVTLASRSGAGTTITLFLPRAQGGEPPQQKRARAEVDFHDTGKILMVEDNTEVGDGICQLLEEVGYTVRLCRNAVDAKRLLDEGHHFDLLLTDLVMAGDLDGMQLASFVQAEHPSIPVILMTGYSSEVRKASSEGFTILIKPFQISQLVGAIRDRIARTAAKV